MAAFTLQIKDEDGNTSQVVSLDQDEVTVGRLEANTIQLAEKNVSRRHLRIIQKDGEIYVEDLSRYGTRINGSKVKEPRRIGHGDVLAVGDFRLAVETEAGAAQVASADVELEPEVEEDARDTRERPTPPAEAESPLAQPREEDGVERTALVSIADVEAIDAARSKKRLGAEHDSLFVVTTSLAGTRLDLTEDVMKIGRTPDNDLVVDHRSISRNHARVTRKGGTVTIRDLGSANGMKVNGEYYNESVLRRGDIIELGHVKLRFVPSGEAFVFNPDDFTEDAAPVEEKKKGGMIWIVLAILILILGGVAAAWFLYFGKPAGEEVVGKAGDKAAAVAPAPSPPKAEAPEPPPKEAPPAEPKEDIELKATLIAASNYMKNESWSDAVSAYSKALAIDGNNEEAQAGLEKANSERKLGKVYETAKAQVDADQLDAAWETLANITEVPAESIYAARINELRKGVKLREVQGLVEQAKAARRAQEQLDLAKKALEIDPESSEALEIKQKAERRLAAPPEPAPRHPRPTTGTAPRDTSGGMSAKDLYMKGRELHNSKPSEALSYYQKAASKGYTKAYKLMGSLYLQQGKNAAAIKAYKRYLASNPPDAELIKAQIQRAGGTP